MNLLLRGVRVIDPLRAVDALAQDVHIQGGVITAVGRSLDPAGVPVVDLTPEPGRSWHVLCPGFIDLHAHLREPGGERAETIVSGAHAAASGGFTQVVAMANTDPPCESAERVREAVQRAQAACVDVLTVATLTRGLRGATLVDIEGCAEAGAVAFSDDGRNAATAGVLVEGLRRAAAVDRPVLVHPEDETLVAPLPAEAASIVRNVHRPPEVETAAVASALHALRDARVGCLHLQHLSLAESVRMLAEAKEERLAVTAEVAPHHLSMWLPSPDQAMTNPLLKVNPPLRTREDRDALVQALREGIIDCIATDHAPHTEREKTLSYADAAPGIIGLETALAVCLTLAGAGEDWLPGLIDRLTAGPYRVLRSTGLLLEPCLRTGEAASCVLIDPDAEWVVGDEPLQSRSANTPLMGATLRGRVLLTLHRGRVVHRDPRFAPLGAEPAGV